MAETPIPVTAASEIGRAFKKSAVIVAGWEPATGLTHVATWGSGAEERDVAAKAGERVAALLTGTEVRRMYEDFRGSGAARIAIERERQIREEGWTPEHDDEHAEGELLAAADCYVAHAQGDACDVEEYVEAHWPWDSSSWKPSDDPIRNLVKAGALIAAEIDRLVRAKGQR